MLLNCPGQVLLSIVQSSNEKFTLLRMHVDKVHDNSHGYVAVPPPCLRVYVRSGVVRLLFSDGG